MEKVITFEQFYISQGDNPKGVTAHNAWQHQQSIIDEQNKRIDGLRKKAKMAFISIEDGETDRCVKILKGMFGGSKDEN